MKKINHLVKLAYFAIPLIGFATFPFQSLKQNSSILLESQVSNEIDLAVKPLVANIVDEEQRKTLVHQENVANLYQNNSVLSIHTINTVRSAEYYFNFINSSDNGNKINIIATPVDANTGQTIVLKTNFTTIEDSAVYLNKNLVLIGTINNQKFLVNYQIELFFDEINMQYKLILQEKAKINVSQFFAPIVMHNKKFALSPFSKNLNDTLKTSLILWPMGATVADFNANKNSSIYEVSIGLDGHISTKPFELNFLFTNNNDEIVSITPLQVIDNQGEVSQIKFYAFTRGANASTPIRILEFGLKNSSSLIFYSAYDQNQVPNTNYVKPDLNKVAPYAMVRIDENNDFYLFWINQNSASRSGEALVTPEAIIRVKVELSNNNLVSIKESDITTIEFQEQEENIVGHAQIQQIHYALGKNTGDSYMGLRFNNAFFANDNVQFNNFWTGSFPLNVPFHNGTEIIDSFISATVMAEWFTKSQRSSSNASIALENKDVNVMTTIANGIVTQGGIDYYLDEVLLNQPLIFRVSRRIDDYLLVWNTAIDNNEIYLPQTSVLQGLTDPTNINSTYPLPIKIKDINFEKNIDGSEITSFPENSILWYARYFINDLSQWHFYGNAGRYNLTTTGTLTFQDINGKVINNTLDADGTAPDAATAVQLSITIPNPIINGATPPGQPLTIQMNFFDNPGSPSTGTEIISVNENYIEKQASSAGNILNSFKEFKTIPANQSIIGTDSSNLFNINQFYLKNAFKNLEVQTDDFLGKLDVTFQFQDQDNNLYLKSFSINGFRANYIIIPSVLAPILVIIFIILTIVLVLNKKNKLKAAQSEKAGEVLAKRIAIKYEMPENSMTAFTNQSLPKKKKAKSLN